MIAAQSRKVLAQLVQLTRSFGRSSLATRLCLCAWALAALLGAHHILSGMPGYLRLARLPDVRQRLVDWGPTYGFAVACLPSLSSGTSIQLVDPTGRVTGATQYLQAPDVDLDDERAFAYAVYPHLIQSLGHVPANWSPAASSADYIALWERASYQPATASTVQALGSARAAEGTLRAMLPGRQVCTYQDAQGDRGVVFAVSPRAAHALAAAHAGGSPASAGIVSTIQLPQTGSVRADVLALAGLLSLFLIGLILLAFIPRLALPRGLAVAAALPLGCLGISVELLILSLLHLPWSPALLALPWLAVAAGVYWRMRQRRVALDVRGLGRRLTTAWVRLALDERIVLGALAAILVALALLTPLGLPYGDGLNFAYFKAHAFFVDGSVIPYSLHASSMAFSVPNHPPLVPLSITWLYLFIGHVDEHASLLLWPAMFASLLMAFYALARTVASRRIALWSTLGLVLVAYDLFGAALWASYSDMPLAVIVLLGCGLLWYWGGRGDHPWPSLVLAGVLLAAAAWTKEEAIPLAVLAFVASPLLRIESARGWSALRTVRWWRPMVWAVPAFVVVALPLLLFQRAFPAPEVTVSLTGMHLTTLMPRMITIAVGVVERIARSWWPVLVMIGAWAALRWRTGQPLLAGVSGRTWFIAIVIVMQVAADSLGMLASPAEVHNALDWDANRLLSQVVPLVFLAGVALWGRIEAQASRATSPVPAPEQALVIAGE